jgi:hypothetical protein
MNNGKGDSPRPVDREKYDQNYSEIIWDERRCPGDCKSSEVCERNISEKGMECKNKQVTKEP